MKFVVFFLVTAVVLFAWSQATPQVCGDVNDDGGYNIGDAVYLVSYLYNGGPEPPAYTYADADGYRVLTPNDLILIMTHRPATCPPTQRKFSGPPNSGYPPASRQRRSRYSSIQPRRLSIPKCRFSYISAMNCRTWYHARPILIWRTGRMSAVDAT